MRIQVMQSQSKRKMREEPILLLVPPGTAVTQNTHTHKRIVEIKFNIISHYFSVIPELEQKLLNIVYFIVHMSCRVDLRY